MEMRKHVSPLRNGILSVFSLLGFFCNHVPFSLFCLHFAVAIAFPLQLSHFVSFAVFTFVVFQLPVIFSWKLHSKYKTVQLVYIQDMHIFRFFPPLCAVCQELLNCH